METIKNYMKERYEDYIDECGELNLTNLCEDVADRLSLYIDEINFEIKEEVWEIAFEIEQELFDLGILNY